MIERATLRRQVRERIRNWIIDGELPPGSRIAEPVTAARLGVSRTPLREALLGLEKEGLVISVPGKGFRVAPLSVDLVHEIYPILGALEGLALRLQSLPDRERREELRHLNDHLADEHDDPRRQAELDREWHQRLLDACPNRRLLALIQDFTSVIRRFDGATRRGVADLTASCLQHRAILTAIDEGDLPRASSLLEEHWISCITPVEKWLREHSPDDP